MTAPSDVQPDDVERPPGSTEGLGRRAARGAVITLGGQGARIVLQTLSVVVLARLLDATDYGLVAMVVAIVGVGEVFRDFGLSSAAIQAKTLSDRQRTNLFWLNAAIGALLALVVFLAAPLLARVYDHDQVTGIARALSLTFLLNGLATQFRADLNRRLRFGLLTTADIASPAAGLALAVVGAVFGWGYWALVAQQLAQSVMLLVLLVAFARFRPGLPRRGAEIGGMVRFGGNLVASQLVQYLTNNIDSIVIGVRFGPSPLGLYNRGFQLLMTPLSQMRAPSTTVALPILSRLQDDTRRYVDFVVRGQLAMGYTLVAGLGLVIGAAPQVTDVFLGDRWDGVAPILRLLAVAGAFQTLAYVGYWVYLSRGLTGALLRYTLATAPLRIACVVGGSAWGIEGVAAGYALAPALAWPISLFWLSRVSGLPLRPLVLGALRILVVTGVVAAASAGGAALVPGLPAIGQLGVAVAAGLAGYLLVLAVVPMFRRDAAGIVETARMVPAARKAAPAAPSGPTGQPAPGGDSA